jgi:hypothetical protein
MPKYLLRNEQETESFSVIKPAHFILRKEIILAWSETTESHKTTIFGYNLGFLDYDLVLCKLTTGP